MPKHPRKYRRMRKLKCNLNAPSARAAAPPATPPVPTPPVIIDSAAFPHIVEAILAVAPYKALLRLRGTCKAYKRPAEKRIMHHVLVWPDGWMSSRLAPHKHLPWLDPFEERERLLDVHVLDVHRDANLGDCAWWHLVGDDRLIAGHKLPVLRRWGWDDFGGQVAAHTGIAFLDVPGEGCTYDLTLDGCDVRIFEVPHPRHKMVSTCKTPVFVRTSCDKIVYRRRSIFDELAPTDHHWHRPEHDNLLSEHIAHLLNPEVNYYGFNQGEDPYPHARQIVVVDYEGSTYEGVKKVQHRGGPYWVWPQTHEPWPFDRSEMIRYAKHFITHPEEHLVDERVSLLSMEEYRASAGDAYAYEEEDHYWVFKGRKRRFATLVETSEGAEGVGASV